MLATVLSGFCDTLYNERYSVVKKVRMVLCVCVYVCVLLSRYLHVLGHIRYTVL